MLRFLKSLFKREKEELSIERISLDELESWLGKKEAILLSDLQQRIKQISEVIEEEKRKIRQSIEILQSAKLQNPNIPLRAKQMMEGNREVYIKFVKAFVDGLEMPLEYRQALRFCDDFHQKLLQFGKSTLRPYQVLQEFFAHESKAVAMHIKAFEHHIKQLQRIIRENGAEKMEELKKKAYEILAKIKLKETYEKELQEALKKEEDLVSESRRIEEHIKKLEQSEEYALYHETKAEKEVLLTQLREHNSVLVHSFSVLEAALKKYNKTALEHNELIQAYLFDPVRALQHDAGLHMLNVLGNIEKSILANKIDLKDKKREKTLEELGRLNKEFLEKFIQRYNELNERLKGLEASLEGNKTAQELQGQLRRKEDAIGEISNMRERLRNLKSELEKIQIDEMKEELKARIKALWPIEVVIS